MAGAALMSPEPGERLSLPQVTLCAVSSSNVDATVRAMQASIARVQFGEAILFTDAEVDVADTGPGIRIERIEPLRSTAAYSDFILMRLVDYVATSHCLVMQWDGHVIDAARWQPEFLDYDYIGASWPQFDDARRVGNGGFSLRSRRLMEACRTTEFVAHHPEDLAICRTNGALLEDKGLRFAPVELADRFSAERSGDPASSFGYHGAFLMPRVLGADEFWEIYRGLDARGSMARDYGNILRDLRKSKISVLRDLRMLGHWGTACVKRRASSVSAKISGLIGGNKRAVPGGLGPQSVKASPESSPGNHKE